MQEQFQINLDDPIFEKIKKRVLKEVFPKSYMRHKYYEDKVAEIVFIIYDELIENDNKTYDEFEDYGEYEFGNKISKKKEFDIDEDMCFIVNKEIEFEMEL
jgi:hypothetical protein